MSVRAMSLVWDAPIVPTSMKLLVLALADWANDDGGSLHPSMAAIARKVGVSDCQARRLARDMKSAGVLAVVANAHGGAPGSTPHYRLDLGRIGSWTGSVGARGGAGDRAGVDERRRLAPMRETASAGASQTTNNHQKNHQRQDGAFEELFDRFWVAYPRKVAKADARKAFAKLRPTQDLLTTLLQALTRQLASAQWQRDGGKFIPHASTWLNGQRWEDEVDVPDRQATVLAADEVFTGASV